jgi:hypothetical protein
MKPKVVRAARKAFPSEVTKLKLQHLASPATTTPTPARTKVKYCAWRLGRNRAERHKNRRRRKDSKLRACPEGAERRKIAFS